ncbi:MAG TPA: CopD family protein [Luteibaculaceae bacterium]|nr:CopD family protein [Luteibaculaceae bacterium]
MTPDYFYIKALHIIFMVSWFAGLFYLPRLFIYHVEAQDKTAEVRSAFNEQFKLMQRRLWYIITWPAAILTFVFGFWMLYIYPEWLTAPWMHLKLGLVFLLAVYHLACGRLFSKHQRDVFPYSSFKLRLWNEVATLLLIAIVFVVVLKDTISWLYGILGIFIIAGGLTFAVARYKKRRERAAAQMQKGA